MVALYQTDRLGFRAGLERFRGAFELEIRDHGDDIAVFQNISMGILYDPLNGCPVSGCRFQSPFMAAGDAFVVVREGQDFVHGAERAGGSWHWVKGR